MKSIIKSLLNKTPYRIVRGHKGNRFQAIGDTLHSVRARGFRPQVIIDGGANVGDFSREMLRMFPEARIHAFEPQPGCAAPLAALAAGAGGRLIVHNVALCAPENAGTTLAMAGDAQSISTGAHVVPAGHAAEHGTIDVRCATLDGELAGQIHAGEDVLIKLDLQGYELEALKGATRTLAAAQLVLSEISFFRQAYEPPIETLVAYLSDQGFELYDIASLYARPRDNRAKQGDFMFVRRDGALAADTAWS